MSTGAFLSWWKPLSEVRQGSPPFSCAPLLVQSAVTSAPAPLFLQPGAPLALWVFFASLCSGRDSAVPGKEGGTESWSLLTGGVLPTALVGGEAQQGLAAPQLALSRPQGE